MCKYQHTTRKTQHATAIHKHHYVWYRQTVIKQQILSNDASNASVCVWLCFQVEWHRSRDRDVISINMRIYMCRSKTVCTERCRWVREYWSNLSSGGGSGAEDFGLVARQVDINSLVCGLVLKDHVIWNKPAQHNKNIKGINQSYRNLKPPEQNKLTFTLKHHHICHHKCFQWYRWNLLSTFDFKLWEQNQTLHQSF